MSAVVGKGAALLDQLPPLASHTAGVCPRRLGWFRDPRSGLFRRRDRCGAWWCPGCGPVKARDAESRVRLGLDVADDRGRDAALLTLTLPDGCNHLALARRSFTRLVESVRRAPGGRRRLVDSVCVVEQHRADGGRFRVHLHAVVLHSGLSAAEIEARSRRQFGHVAVQPVRQLAEDRARVAGYVTKDLHATAVEMHRGNGRVAPITFSRAWPSIERGHR